MSAAPANFPHAFVRDCLQLVADHYGGDLTLNQFRVLQYLAYLRSTGTEHASHGEICTGLGLPAATVTRAVTGFKEKGVLTEETDPVDARRRLIRINADAPGRQEFEQRLIELVGEHLDPG